MYQCRVNLTEWRSTDCTPSFLIVSQSIPHPRLRVLSECLSLLGGGASPRQLVEKLQNRGLCAARWTLYVFEKALCAPSPEISLFSCQGKIFILENFSEDIKINVCRKGSISLVSRLSNPYNPSQISLKPSHFFYGHTTSYVFYAFLNKPSLQMRCGTPAFKLSPPLECI